MHVRRGVASTRDGARLGGVLLATLIALALPGPVAAADPVLVGAGDIASCARTADTATARLIAAIPGTVFTTGDNAYEHGTLAEFRNCYGPTWGQFRSRTRPTAGDHEYDTPGAAGYFSYFGSRAGPVGKGYYAYNLGHWRIYALNSNCTFVRGCRPTSAQTRWLQADLAANPRRCVLAYWHEPLFSSGSHGNIASVRPFWDVLYAARADVIVNGNDHDYERFAPQKPWGEPSSRGIREFVVGTGGGQLRPWGTIKRNSVARNAGVHGVLKLTLHASTYDWRFVPQAGKTWTDSGTGVCRA